MKNIVSLFLSLIFSFSLSAQFSSVQVIMSQNNYQMINIGDADDDNDLDILVTFPNGSNHKAGIYRNYQSSGKYERYSPVNTALSKVSVSMLIDFNNDQTNDIIMGGSGLYLREGIPNTGMFASEQPLISDTFGVTINLIRLIDWNGDGISDIVYGTTDSETLWMEHLDGNGNFASPKLISEGFSTSFGDFDNDTDTDVILILGDSIFWHEKENANYIDRHLISSAFPGIKRSLVKDIDNDDDLDLIVMGHDTTGIGWFENEDGLGNFSDFKIISTAITSGGTIIAKDMNGDDESDLLVSSYSGNNLFLLENLGSASDFSSPVSLASGIQEISNFQVWDIDNDNDNDIITVKKSYGEILWFSNIDGMGEMSEQRFISKKNLNRAVTTADIDGDNDLDIVAGGQGVIWVENLDGQGSFGGVNLIDIDLTTNDVRKIYTADIDGDNDQDIITIWELDFKWYENLDGKGTFGIGKTIAGTEPKDITLTDFDGDGDTDILADYRFYQNIDGQGQSWVKTDLIPFSSLNLVNIRHFDIGNDGDLDLIGNVWSGTGNIGWHENTGGIFGDLIVLDETFPENVGPFHDWNNDNTPDILADENQKFVLYETIGNNLDLGNVHILGTAQTYSPFVVEDINFSGYLDLVVANDGINDEIILFEGNNNGFESQQVLYSGQSFSSIYTADFDSDGDKDIVLGAHWQNQMVWIENFYANDQIIASCFLDENEDGIKDTNEPILKNQKIELSPNAEFSWTNNDGKSFFAVGTGDYEINYYPTPDFEPTTSATQNITITDLDDMQNVEFGVAALNDYSFLNPDISAAAARCNFEVPFWITVLNEGTRIDDGRVRFTLDDLTELVSTVPMPDSVSGNELFWNYNDLTPTDSREFKLILKMPDENSIGEQLYFESETFVWDNGDLVSNFSNEYTSVITCAYDPNDKLVTPNRSEAYEKNYVLFGEELEYTIRFQNTGNDTAFNIEIRDTLDWKLDLTTFRPVTASHNFETHLGENGEVTFKFPNILLPDTLTNEPASHGFVKYRISPIPGLPENTKITNTAFIYFDFNQPIVTNTDELELVSELPIIDNTYEDKNELKIMVRPNPLSSNETLSVETNLVGFEVQIFDIAGRTLMEKTVKSNSVNLPMENVENGIYFLQLTSRNVRFSYKIVILNR